MIRQLNGHPLAELIREISASDLSGALRLARESAKTVVYFDAGEVVYAASNLRAFRLSECARRWGALTEQHLSRSDGKGSDFEFGAALLEAGALDREALAELVNRQVSEILCHALLWTDGQWAYDARVRLAADVRARVKTEELLMECARRLPAALAETRLSGRDGTLTVVAGAGNNVALLPTEAFILSRVDSNISVSELLAIGGLPEPEILRLIYTLALGGFLSFDNWPRSLSEVDLEQGRTLASSKQAQATDVASQKEAVAETRAEPEKKEEEPDERSELEAFFKRLDLAENFYQILGVVRPAKDADIKRAYHSLAKRFHPDHFRKTVDQATHARIESSFARIAQAYEALKDSNQRATYDTKLFKQEEIKRSAVPQTQPPPKPASASSGGFEHTNVASPRPNNIGAPARAEEKYQQGLSALRSGDHTLAIGYLGEASMLMPTQPRYRAHYGQALANEERMRRNAEAEFKAAISLDPNNASYHVMLAEFYVGLGHLRRAQGELERAVALEPGNKEARRLLDKLKQ